MACNNKNYNYSIWQFAPKHIFSATKIIKIAAFLVVCIFNKEFSLLLKILEVMGIKIGPQQKYSSTRKTKFIYKRQHDARYKRQRRLKQQKELNDLKNKNYLRMQVYYNWIS